MLTEKIAVHKPDHKPFTADERDLVIENAVHDEENNVKGTLVENDDESVVVIGFSEPIGSAQHKRVVARINKAIKIQELHNHPEAESDIADS